MLSLKQYIDEQTAIGGFNISRADMPQIDDQEAFAAYLEFVGIAVNRGMVQLGGIKPTQNEFDPAKVANIKAPYGAILVSSDNFILDGHHRFFAAQADDACDMIDAYVCNATINHLLKHASDFLTDE